MLRNELRRARLHLNGHVERPDLDALAILSHLIGRPTSWILAHDETPMTTAIVRRYRSLVRRRKNGWPLPYLLGTRSFLGREFIVTPKTLIPRPATETLVAHILDTAQPTARRILELGTGTGCIAISLALARPDWELVATEKSPAALRVARLNAKRLKAIVRFVQTGSFSSIADHNPDLIVANLPYLSKKEIRQNKLRFEPSLALDGRGSDGLGIYRQLIHDLPRTFHGAVYIECLPRQHAAIKQQIRRRWPKALIGRIGAGRFPAGLQFRVPN